MKTKAYSEEGYAASDDVLGLLYTMCLYGVFYFYHCVLYRIIMTLV